MENQTNATLEFVPVNWLPSVAFIFGSCVRYMQRPKRNASNKSIPHFSFAISLCTVHLTVFHRFESNPVRHGNVSDFIIRMAKVCGHTYVINATEKNANNFRSFCNHWYLAFSAFSTCDFGRISMAPLTWNRRSLVEDKNNFVISQVRFCCRQWCVGHPDGNHRVKTGRSNNRRRSWQKCQINGHIFIWILLVSRRACDFFFFCIFESFTAHEINSQHSSEFHASLLCRLYTRDSIYILWFQ